MEALIKLQQLREEKDKYLDDSISLTSKTKSLNNILENLSQELTEICQLTSASVRSDIFLKRLDRSNGIILNINLNYVYEIKIKSLKTKIDSLCSGELDNIYDYLKEHHYVIFDRDIRHYMIDQNTRMMIYDMKLLDLDVYATPEEIEKVIESRVSNIDIYNTFCADDLLHLKDHFLSLRKDYIDSFINCYLFYDLNSKKLLVYNKKCCHIFEDFIANLSYDSLEYFLFHLQDSISKRIELETKKLEYIHSVLNS